MSQYRPVDLPELRAELAAYTPEPGQPAVGPAIRAAREAELFYVSSDMVSLTQAAKESLPDFTVLPEDLPAPCGFMYFETPIHTYEYDGTPASIVGSVWSLTNGLLGCSWLIDARGYFEAAHGLAAMRAVPMLARLPRLFPIESSIWFHEDIQAQDGAVMPLWARLFMKSAWLLMQQPVTVVATDALDRSTRKRLKRQGVEERPVRIITLRRASTASEAGGGDREYHHQWIVRGHWRQQWYPSREVHRPVWIAPHVKGPEGAPMLGGDRVYAWKR